MLSGRRVLVGICGSIAAYKAAEVVRGLVKAGATVRVMMTPAATRFVGPATFAALSGERVHLDLFDRPERVVHVELARWAEVMLVCGATASTLRRFAAGGAEEIVSATYLMARCPVVVAPAMHTEMWEHPSVRRNVERVQSDGALLVPPAVGDLASGDHGVGRLAETEEILGAVREILGPRDLDGLRVVVTAGPTREQLDPVRFLSNRSSGRMGFALAAEAARRGAAVVVVAGPTSATPPAGIEIVRVQSAQEMLDECLVRFGETDVVVKAAAVADWRPAQVSGQKVKKSEAKPLIHLEPTPDIAAELGRKKGTQTLVLFAAETSDVVAYATDKLARKNADLVVANTVGQPGTGFDTETNDAVMVTRDGAEPLRRMSKADLARLIWDRVIRLRADGASR